MPNRTKSLTASIIAVIGMLAAGCSVPSVETAAPEPATLNVYVPCVLSGPVQKVVAAYQDATPDIEILVVVEKPMAMLDGISGAEGAAGVALTTGPIEMQSLIDGGAVDPAEVRTFAVNTYPIVAIAAADGARGVQELSDISASEVERVYIDDPARSSLGEQTERVLKGLGLWEGIAPKVVRPKPDQMLLAGLLAGDADVAFVFRDCLFEGTGDPTAVPKTIRLIGQLPPDSDPPIAYKAAPLCDPPGGDLARGFVEFLVSAEGREALSSAGLRPPDTR
jgi:molybdate transport system substrate-binding protein